MPLPQSLRNDQIKRAPNRIPARMPEYSLGTGIPEPDDAVAVGRDDCVGARREKSFGKQFRKIHVLLVRSIPCGRFHRQPYLRNAVS
jgi:hypothetical protein